MKKRCLYCYQLLEREEDEFHSLCSRKIFGKPIPPLLPYTEAQMLQLAEQVIRSRITVTGVQPKLSLDLEPAERMTTPQRFTIVRLWGTYILKPPTKDYPHLPEVEDVTMHLASLSKIKTVPHSLIRLQNGSLAYITKRIDRIKSGKIHMEDMCQLTERLTEHKYDGSYEQIARAILKFSANPVLDVVIFYEQVIFSFLTGNADMHLKNFSLIKDPLLGYSLSPAYDMVATALVNPSDQEELALTLNGKKRKLKRNDFISAFQRVNLDEKVIERMFKKFEKLFALWFNCIDISFLPLAMKKEYKKIIASKAAQLNIKTDVT